VRHVYLHVPFCRRRCSYCDFSIAVRREIPSDAYVAAIRAELAQLRRDGRWTDEPAETLYFGGGTPSLLDPESLRTMLLDVASSTPLLDAVEITLEANPEDVTSARAASWRAAGINRVSLGAQSFNERVLAWMHRAHSAARTVDAVHQLRAAGFTSISLDLIFALPAELGRDWDRDLDVALALAPEHLSLYGLTIEDRTPLARWISRGAASAAPDERYADEYLRAHERLRLAGYEFYEVSNAARPGMRSRHNSAYWSGRAYAGLGPAAHSFDGRARRWNAPAWEAYRRAVTAGRSPAVGEEALTDEQRRLEAAYLGWRTAEGVPVEAVPAERAAGWAAQGWVAVRNGRVTCTPEGWLRLDALVGGLTGHGAAL
jgi:oxygen-independent coproporphyrinogen-3 oxidase